MEAQTPKTLRRSILAMHWLFKILLVFVFIGLHQSVTRYFLINFNVPSYRDSYLES